MCVSSRVWVIAVYSKKKTTLHLHPSGIVKLEVGDHLELLIPRSTANVSLYGDATFMGAVKLA